VRQVRWLDRSIISWQNESAVTGLVRGIQHLPNALFSNFAFFHLTQDKWCDVR
jgi:hypothetical protein